MSVTEFSIDFLITQSKRYKDREREREGREVVRLEGRECNKKKIK